jgi:hypothetical protein
MRAPGAKARRPQQFRTPKLIVGIPVSSGLMLAQPRRKRIVIDASRATARPSHAASGRDRARPRRLSSGPPFSSSLPVSIGRDARRHVVEQRGNLIFDDRAFFLDHENLVAGLGKRAQPLGSNRPDHADLIDADAQRRRARSHPAPARAAPPPHRDRPCRSKRYPAGGAWRRPRPVGPSGWPAPRPAPPHGAARNAAAPPPAPSPCAARKFSPSGGMA